MDVVIDLVRALAWPTAFVVAAYLITRNLEA